MDLDHFPLSRPDFADLLGVAPSTLSTWHDRHGAFRLTANGPRGQVKEYRLGDGMRALAAAGLQRAGIEVRRAWDAAAECDALGRFIMGEPVEFGLVASVPLLIFDHHTPVISINLERDGQRLVNGFAAYMVRDHGGPAADAALRKFDRECRDMRGGEVIESPVEAR